MCPYLASCSVSSTPPRHYKIPPSFAVITVFRYIATSVVHSCQDFDPHTAWTSTYTRSTAWKSRHIIISTWTSMQGRTFAPDWSLVTSLGWCEADKTVCYHGGAWKGPVLQLACLERSFQRHYIVRAACHRNTADSDRDDKSYRKSHPVSLLCLRLPWTLEIGMHRSNAHETLQMEKANGWNGSNICQLSVGRWKRSSFGEINQIIVISDFTRI